MCSGVAHKMNITQLQNIPPFSFNNSMVNDSTEILTNMTTNVDSASGGYFGITVMLVLYITITYLLNRDDELFRLDFARSSLVASFFALSVGIILTNMQSISNFRHVMIMAIIFLISFIIVWQKKQQGK